MVSVLGNKNDFQKRSFIIARAPRAISCRVCYALCNRRCVGGSTFKRTYKIWMTWNVPSKDGDKRTRDNEGKLGLDDRSVRMCVKKRS